MIDGGGYGIMFTAEGGAGSVVPGEVGWDLSDVGLWDKIGRTGDATKSFSGRIYPILASRSRFHLG